MDMPVVEEHLCFALYSASRAMTAIYRPLLEELGLTYPQYLVMVVLWEQDAVRVSDLGSRLSLDSGTLSPLLRRLEQRGLVARARSRADERVVEVSLTDAGAALEHDARAVVPKVFDACGLTPSEFDVLRRSVQGLARSLGTSTTEATTIPQEER